jgi:hypothetical protein
LSARQLIWELRRLKIKEGLAVENSDKRIVEINGIKIEVDLRTAKRVDQYKIGDKVKVLVKEYSNYVSYPGIIAAFDEFHNLPTITVVYVKTDYNKAEIRYAYINSKTEDAEIAPCDDSWLPLKQSDMNASFENEILKKQQEIEDIKRKQWYFNQYFGRYFSV